MKKNAILLNAICEMARIYNIFDEVIYDILHMVQKIYAEKCPTTDGTVYFTKWAYDTKTRKAIYTENKNEHHPIYIVFKKDKGYAFSVTLRNPILDQDVRNHDPIYVNINTNEITEDNILERWNALAEEFNHVSTMWDTDEDFYLHDNNTTYARIFNDDIFNPNSEKFIVDVDEYSKRIIVDALYLMSETEFDRHLDGFSYGLRTSSDEELSNLTSCFKDKKSKIGNVVEHYKSYLYLNSVTVTRRVLRFGFDQLNKYGDENALIYAKRSLLFICILCYAGYAKDPLGTLSNFNLLKWYLSSPKLNFDYIYDHLKELRDVFNVYDKRVDEYIYEYHKVAEEELEKRGLLECSIPDFYDSGITNHFKFITSFEIPKREWNPILLERLENSEFPQEEKRTLKDNMNILFEDDIYDIDYKWAFIRMELDIDDIRTSV